MWDENGGKEETERLTVMKRKWEREGATDRETDPKWGWLTSIGATEKHWGNEEIVEEEW